MVRSEKTQAGSFITIPRLTGKYQEVRVTFIGASFSRSGQHRYADDDFGQFIIDEIFRRQSILTKYKGVLRKAHHCRKCGADLTGEKTHRRRFFLDMAYKQFPPFKIEMEMSGITCRHCATNNAINDQNTEYVVCGAIAKAFESLKRLV
jgi:ribosomal protein L34E